MRRQRLVAAGLVAAVLFCGVRAGAEDLADRVPADAVAFARWAGSDAAGPAYNSSHLKAFLDALKLREFVVEHYQPRVAARAAASTQDAADQATWQEVLRAVGHAPTAIYVGPFEFPANGQPAPRVAVFSKVGAAEAGKLAPQLQTEMDREKTPNEPAQGAVAAGDYLLVYVGDANISERLTGAAPAENLAAVAGYQKAMVQLGAGAADAPAVVYVDAGAAVKTLSAAVDKSQNVQAQRIYGPLVEGLGLSNMNQCAWAGRFDGANWRSDFFLGMGEERNGMLAFLDFPAIADETLKLIPKSATTAGVVRFDGVKLLEQIAAAADAATANGGQRIDQAMNQIWTFTGFDFKAVMFPGLGDEFVYYGMPAAAGAAGAAPAGAAGNLIGGLTILNRLRDAKKAESAMEGAESFVNAAIQQRDPNSKAQFQAQALPAPWQDVTAHVMTLPKFAPSWAIRGGILYFSMSVQALEDSLEMADGKKASILENPQFAELRKRLGGRPFFSFGFEDLPASAAETYGLVERAIGQAPAGAGAKFALPPLEQNTPTLGPAMQISWSDGAGYHMQGAGPFPLASYLNPLEFMGLAAQEVQVPRLPQGAARGGGLGWMRRMGGCRRKSEV